MCSTSGAQRGDPPAHTDAGPPERMIARGRSAWTSAKLAVHGRMRQ